jgi:hypothetical protein
MNYKLTLLAVFIMASATIAAQSYTPFEAGGLWSVNNTKYKAVGDTLLNGREYIKVYQQQEKEAFEFNEEQAEYCCAFRNDTLNKRVYFAVPDGINVYNTQGDLIFQTANDTELLFYDFSLEVGLTITCYKWESEGITETHITRKDSIDIYTDYFNIYYHFDNSDSIINVGNRSYRRILLTEKTDNKELPKIWIEGIGSISGFQSAPEHIGACPAPTFLLCYSDSNDNVYYSGFDLDADTADCFSLGSGVGIKEHNKTDVTIQLHPNPTKGMIEIKSNNLNIKQIELFDIFGKLLMEKKANESTVTLDVSPYAKGMYLLRYTLSDDTQQTKKIIRK